MPKGLSSPSEMPPILDLNESQLPQLKNWKIGSKYRIIVEAEMIQHGKGYDGAQPYRASFKVLSAKSGGESTAPDEKDKTAPSRNDKISVMASKAKEA